MKIYEAKKGKFCVPILNDHIVHHCTVAYDGEDGTVHFEVLEGGRAQLNYRGGVKTKILSGKGRCIPCATPDDWARMAPDLPELPAEAYV